MVSFLYVKRLILETLSRGISKFITATEPVLKTFVKQDNVAYLFGYE